LVERNIDVVDAGGSSPSPRTRIYFPSKNSYTTCVSERPLNQFSGPEKFDYPAYKILLNRANPGAYTLTPEEREQLIRCGYHFLEIEKNTYEATCAFDAAQDFSGLRKVVEHLLEEYRNSIDVPKILNLLEDHEGIRDFLNTHSDLETYAYYEEAFESVRNELYRYITEFWQKNGTSAATGILNEGVDCIALHNLAQDYDIAIPIACGGLKQGAVAHLLGIPTRIADIHAHNQPTAEGTWINSVTAEDFDGKKVLLLDKDAVSGATIQEAVDMLKEFKVKEIGVYFAHPILPPNATHEIGTNISGLLKDLKIFAPRNVPMTNAGDAYIETHEKLGTLYGRRRQIERLFLDEATALQDKFPTLAEALKAFTSKHIEMFDLLNPKIPGISEVREQILLKMNNLYQEHKDFINTNTYSDLPDSIDRFIKILDTAEPLSIDFESQLIKARYQKKGEDMAKKRSIENIHYPSNPLAAFNAAQKAVQNGFDVALIVGPEGFAYEPYFQDLGIDTVAINIPENTEGEPRNITLLNDLSILEGRKVLVVEDDVNTGATLTKLLEGIESYHATELGLYLGQPKKFQKIMNIPPAFEKVYIAQDISPTAGKEYRDFMETKGYRIFKTNL